MDVGVKIKRPWNMDSWRRNPIMMEALFFKFGMTVRIMPGKCDALNAARQGKEPFVHPMLERVRVKEENDGDLLCILLKVEEKAKVTMKAVYRHHIPTFRCKYPGTMLISITVMVQWLLRVQQ